MNAPRACSWLARRFEELKISLEGWFRHVLHLPGKVQASLAEPDKLAHHQDARLKNIVARFFMSRKRQAVPRLAARIRDAALPEERRQHALRTLAIITRRNYHREAEGLANATARLTRHGR